MVPKIYDDELLSSWFIRTAYAHHTHPHTFLQLHLGKSGHSLNANNFDIVVDDHDLKTLSYKSNNQFNLYCQVQTKNAPKCSLKVHHFTPNFS